MARLWRTSSFVRPSRRCSAGEHPRRLRPRQFRDRRRPRRRRLDRERRQRDWSGQFTGALTYGVTDRLDIATRVPGRPHEPQLISNATIQRVGTGTNKTIHCFRDDAAIGGYDRAIGFFSEGSAAGIGDMVVRLKGTLMRESGRALAAGIDVRLPTGDESTCSAQAPRHPAVRRFSASFGRLAPTQTSAVRGTARAARRRHQPRRLSGSSRRGHLAARQRLERDRLSVVLDVIGQKSASSTLPGSSRARPPSPGSSGASRCPTSFWRAARALTSSIPRSASRPTSPRISSSTSTCGSRRPTAG